MLFKHTTLMVNKIKLPLFKKKKNNKNIYISGSTMNSNKLYK